MEMIGGINLNGDISATSFSGDGSQITGVSASSVDWGNVENKSVVSGEIADGTIVDGDISGSAELRLVNWR